ncbi:MAG: uroporphyrinogen decarboxylase family protein [Armatimonadota bacterium]
MTAVMTSRERVHALLRRELPDRIGLFDHFWPETIRDNWVYQGYPGVDTNPEDFFDYDMRFGGGGINATPIRDYSEVVEESDEWVLTKGGNGATLRTWKHKSGTPEHVAFDCATPQIWESVYKPYLLVLDPMRVDVESTKKNIEFAHSRDKFTFFGGTFIFETLRYTLGDVVMMESLALEPEWIHDFNRTYTDFFLRHLTYLFDNAGQPDGALIYEDLGYNRGLFCSPTMLKKLFIPYYRELFDFFHDRDMPVILHSCGGVTDGVGLMIDAGIDCLQPMEVKAGVDVLALAQRYKDRLSFMGNLDVRILESGDRSAIEAEIAGKMEALKALGAAYFFHSDHSVSPNVSFASYQYAIEVYREHCLY